MEKNRHLFATGARAGIALLGIVAALQLGCSNSGTKQGQENADTVATDTLMVDSMAGANKAASTAPAAALMAKDMVANQRSRVRDGYGSGQFGSSRDGGVRKHNGIDIIVTAGEKISSPIKGNIVREAVPYRDYPHFRGLVIKGIQEWEGYEVKIFYVEGNLSGQVSELQEIGTAQELKIRYPGITNHIHVEVKYRGIQVDPFTIWQYSF